jgi:hypothetical protein
MRGVDGKRKIPRSPLQAGGWGADSVYTPVLTTEGGSGTSVLSLLSSLSTSSSSSSYTAINSLPSSPFTSFPKSEINSLDVSLCFPGQQCRRG